MCVITSRHMRTRQTRRMWAYIYLFRFEWYSSSYILLPIENSVKSNNCQTFQTFHMVGYQIRVAHILRYLLSIADVTKLSMPWILWPLLLNGCVENFRSTDCRLRFEFLTLIYGYLCVYGMFSHSRSVLRMACRCAFLPFAEFMMCDICLWLSPFDFSTVP